MKTIKFGIDFIDNHIARLPETGIYLLYAENKTLCSLYRTKLMQYNLNLHHPVLWVSKLDIQQNITRNYMKEASLNNIDLLSVLQMPFNIGQYISNAEELDHCLSDLKLYIDNIKPKLLMIENPELLVSENKGTINTTFLSAFMNYLYNLHLAIVVDVTGFDQRSLQVCEKFVEAMFECYDAVSNDHYQLVINKCHTLGKKLTLTFSLDYEHNIVIPKSENTHIYTLEECKQIVLHASLSKYEDLFSEIFNTKLEFLYYQTLTEFHSLNIDFKYAMIVLPAHLQDFNGWQALSWVKRTYPFCKVLFSGSIHTPAAQKVRAIQLGANKFIIYPFEKNSLKAALNEMYKYEEQEQEKYIYHTIIHTIKEIQKSYNHPTIPQNVFFRFIKEYASTLIENGLALHFYKAQISTNSLTDIPIDTLKNMNLVFASHYHTENKHLMLAIFKHLNYDECTKIENILSASFNTISVMAYPIDETNIDILIEWVYQ